MKETRILMGMPVTVHVVKNVHTDKEIKSVIDEAFDYFKYADEKFSTYKDNSEIMKINRSEIKIDNASEDMKEIMRLSEETKNLTDGYFDIVNKDNIMDPSGIVKGWAIWNVSKIIEKKGFNDYYVEAGGDIQVKGLNDEGNKWKIGIKNPLNQNEIVKAVELNNQGIATSGTYIRGQHIYNPKNRTSNINGIVSLSIIGPNIYEADRFATAAFAMGEKGIEFIEKLNGFEGYMIDSKGVATMTSGFNKYVVK